MLLNLILLITVIITIAILYRYLIKDNIDKEILPDCKFIISKPKFEIYDEVRIVKYSVCSKNKNRFFKDFPIGFKFYSKEKFRTKIRISYTLPEDDEIEIIYDKIVDFDDNIKEHIYYINDVIMGTINIEIYTNSYYGVPTIKFEILQNNICHMLSPYALEINFPK